MDGRADLRISFFFCSRPSQVPRTERSGVSPSRARSEAECLPPARGAKRSVSLPRAERSGASPPSRIEAECAAMSRCIAARSRCIAAASSRDFSVLKKSPTMSPTTSSDRGRDFFYVKTITKKKAGFHASRRLEDVVWHGVVMLGFGGLWLEYGGGRFDRVWRAVA